MTFALVALQHRSRRDLLGPPTVLAALLCALLSVLVLALFFGTRAMMKMKKIEIAGLEKAYRGA
jgi:hypothetical protein